MTNDQLPMTNNRTPNFTGFRTHAALPVRPPIFTITQNFAISLGWFLAMLIGVAIWLVAMTVMELWLFIRWLTVCVLWAGLLLSPWPLIIGLYVMHHDKVLGWNIGFYGTLFSLICVLILWARMENKKESKP